MGNLFAITNKNGDQFLVRVVKKGDKYGREYCLTHEEDKHLVEFYDMEYAGKYPDWQFGQFVSRYYIDTLIGLPNNVFCGLFLHGGVEKWQVDGREMAKLREWLRVHHNNGEWGSSW